jgi:hypothetical protein
MRDDTPRTNDRVVFIDGNPWVNAPFALGLERELNAANDLIKRLEEAGDRLAQFTPPTSDRFGAWTRAKEAKP